MFDIQRDRYSCGDDGSVMNHTCLVQFSLTVQWSVVRLAARQYTAVYSSIPQYTPLLIPFSLHTDCWLLNNPLSFNKQFCLKISTSVLYNTIYWHCIGVIDWLHVKFCLMYMHGCLLSYFFASYININTHTHVLLHQCIASGRLIQQKTTHIGRVLSNKLRGCAFILNIVRCLLLIPIWVYYCLKCLIPANLLWTSDTAMTVFPNILLTQITPIIIIKPSTFFPSETIYI